MSSREFSEWLAFDKRHPITTSRAELGAAIVAATVFNQNRDPQHQLDPQAFLPKFTRDLEEDQAVERTQSDVDKYLRDMGFGARPN